MLSGLAVSADYSGCSSCAGPRRVTLGSLAETLSGRSFSSLLVFHLRKHDPDQIRAARRAIMEGFPPSAHPEVEGWRDSWRARTQDPDFWRQDGREALREVLEDAASFLERTGVGSPGSSDLLFDLFELVVLEAAERAHASPEFRQRVAPEADMWRDLGFFWSLAAALAVLAVWTDHPSLELLLGGLAAGFFVLPVLTRWLRRRV